VSRDGRIGGTVLGGKSVWVVSPLQEGESVFQKELRRHGHGFEKEGGGN